MTHHMVSTILDNTIVKYFHYFSHEKLEVMLWKTLSSN